MRFTTPILLAMSCMTSVYSLGTDVPSTINGQSIPDRWIRYDLTPANIVAYLSTTIGAAIKSISDPGSCGRSYGSLDGVSWVYYATGRNCDKAAEATTIRGAIKQHLATTDGNSLCSTECLDLTHSGTWSGFLLIGPTSSFDSTMYCGPSLSFGSCTSGGKNEI